MLAYQSHIDLHWFLLAVSICTWECVSEEERSRHWVTWAPLGRTVNRRSVGTRYWDSGYLSLTCCLSRSRQYGSLVSHMLERRWCVLRTHTCSIAPFLFNFFQSNKFSSFFFLYIQTPDHHKNDPNMRLHHMYPPPPLTPPLYYILVLIKMYN